jgi:PAS domain S-box-containing protein
VCLDLAQAVSRTRTVEEVYDVALNALARGLGASRAAILLFDADGVMRFKAQRGLSSHYRDAVEGHTPWQPDTPDAEPIVVPDVTREASLARWRPAIEAEGIAAMAFIPLVSLDRVIGKFMVYRDTPGEWTDDDLELARLVAAHVAFAVERIRAEGQARGSEERLRFALDAAWMGTWDWDMVANTVRWSDNLERLHGLPAGTFDGTFASYEREIHPDDRAHVLASVRRAMADGVPHDIEYRIVAPDGTVRWVEGKGRVEYEDGKPVRMTGVCMMVTRRKEAELARLAAAEEASRAKDEFLAVLSHELRTPLNAILGWSDMLRSGSLPSDRMPQALETISRNAQLQARLVEDILDLSRIITGKFEMTTEPLAINGLLQSVVDGLRPSAAARGVALTLHTAGDLRIVDGDGKSLQQVFGNVISNAIKFTPQGGSVDVQCRLDGGLVAVAVQDTGPGIPAEFLPYVFDRFRQADSRTTRRHGGLGLGLAIAHHLVTQHGGTIEARSEGAGRGTTIEIRLPVADADPPAVSPVVRTDTTTGDWRMDGCTVVVVDDQADARDLVATLLEQHGAVVLPCDGAASAVQALAGDGVTLLIADLAMPDVDGFTLIRRLREKGSRVPALAVSAYARPADRERALAAGFDGYCTKPLDASAFMGAIRRVLTHR